MLRKSRPRQRPHQVGLSRYDEQRLKEQLRRLACSEPWVEAQFKTAEDTDPRGREIVYRYHDPHVFPPGGSETAMVRCPRCGAFNPPQTFENGACLDHADHRGWGPSPSAIAIRALQMLNLRWELSELPPEDTASLRQEIVQFEQRSAKSGVTNLSPDPTRAELRNVK